MKLVNDKRVGVVTPLLRRAGGREVWMISRQVRMAMDDDLGIIRRPDIVGDCDTQCRDTRQDRQSRSHSEHRSDPAREGIGEEPTGMR